MHWCHILDVTAVTLDVDYNTFYHFSVFSPDFQEGKLPNDLLVGLAEKGEVLARRLDARRHYVQDNLAYDPHFLVFESLAFGHMRGGGG